MEANASQLQESGSGNSWADEAGWARAMEVMHTKGVGTGGQGDPGRAAWLSGQHELWTRKRRGLGRRKARGGRRHGPRVRPDCDMKH